jgi:nucleotide-binding universal stress UspA family protein
MNASLSTSIAAEPRLKSVLPARVVRILVATDGSETSRAAYEAAELIAASRRARVHVLSVLELLPVMVPAPGTPIATTGIDRSREDALRIDMVEQLLKLGRLARWTTEIRPGDPATVIAEVAKERNADLVIVGASPHGMVDRLLGEETAAHLARRINRPLLVAAPSITRLPKRVIVAIDLEPADRTMLVEALETLDSAESVSLVHVTPRAEFLGVDWAEFDAGYHAEAERAFEEASTALETLPRIQPERVVMHGEAAREISQLAESVKAEMIVLGVKPGRTFAVTAGGGVAIKVLRSARCSVLLIPKQSKH